MIVYAASDLHGNLPAVPADADIVLLAGDICPDFGPPKWNHWDYADTSGEQQAAWLDTEFREWLAPMFQRNVHVAATWGNHDYVGQHPELLPDDLNWTVLVDAETTVRGLRIYGTPWVPNLERWAFYGSEAALRARADLIPEGLDFLMTHGPPYAYGDYIPTSEKQRNKYGNHGGMNVGDASLVPAMLRARPRVTLCGHIHPARGQYLLPNNLPLYNVAAVDDLYDLHEQPWRRFVAHEQ